MVFNSVIFIFCFLPIFLLIYYFVPARARNPVLFAGSLFFYAWGDPTYLVLMLFSSFFNYYMGKELGKITDEDPSRKRNLIFAVVINLLILGFFKYWGFLLDTISGVTGLKLTYPQLALPIGLSFYTFKNLSYILDIYMGKTEPCKGFFPYASTMFPAHDCPDPLSATLTFRIHQPPQYKHNAPRCRCRAFYQGSFQEGFSLQTIFPLCTPPFRLPVLPLLWEPGLPLAHIHWSCI